jgi:polar amino acid transport system permease protein
VNILSDWINWLPQLLRALLVSLELTGVTLVIGLPLGFLLAMLALSFRRIVWIPVMIIVEVDRAIPALILLYWVYFGAPELGYKPGAFVAAAAALIISTAAYTSEIFRGGFVGVPPGQEEAAAALGASKWRRTIFVLGPQAIRTVIPAILSFAVLVFQGTSLAIVVGLHELTSRAFRIGTYSFSYMSVLVLAGCIYLVVCVLGARGSDYLERLLALK